MACENCINGCVNPQLCACDCTTCAEANSCDIPVGDTGPQGPSGPQGLPGVNGINGTNGLDGTDGCTLLDVYISDGTDGNTIGDIIVTSGPTPTPCNTVINAGNLLSTIINAGGATIPPGIIVMWAGNPLAIPVGWQLADGTNLQPDLRGRFIASYMAGDPNFGAPMAQGGTLSMSLQQQHIPAHVHGVGGYTATTTVAAVGNHRHTIDAANGTSGGMADKGGGGSTGQYWTSMAGAHTHTATTTLAGVSADGTPALSAPQGNPFPQLPLYYTLCYIIKL